MRYVMIDTNIFIDMIIDRKHNVSDRLVGIESQLD